MVSTGKNPFRALFFRFASIIFLFLVYLYLTPSNPGGWISQLMLFGIAVLSVLLGFWFFSHFIPLAAFLPISKIFTSILRTLRKIKIPTLRVQETDLTTVNIGEKYSEIINPSRLFLIINNKKNFIQIVRKQYYDLQTQDKLLGILSAGRCIKPLTINVKHSSPNTLNNINELDNFSPLSPSEKSERDGYDSVVWSMDIRITFQIASILVQQEETSLSISSSDLEPLITEVIITEMIRKTLEDIWQYILLNKKRYYDKNNPPKEENLDLLIKRFKDKARELCRSGLVLNSLNFIIDLDQILITNLRLANSNPSKSLLSEIDDPLEKSLDIESEKMALLNQHRNLIEESFPKTSEKFTNQELI